MMEEKSEFFLGEGWNKEFREIKEIKEFREFRGGRDELY